MSPTGPSGSCCRTAANTRLGTITSSATPSPSIPPRTPTGRSCAPRSATTSALVLCSVGGTAIGADLLRLCAAAYPHLERRVPGVRMVLACGPRLDPAAVGAPPGVEVRGYVPRLFEQFAACDVAVVQGGGTTTLELTALRRPFLYFPLENHFEQNLVVAERVARHRSGRRMRYAETTPERLADAIVEVIGTEATWPAISSDGARRAAGLITELMPPTTPQAGAPTSEPSTLTTAAPV